MHTDNAERLERLEAEWQSLDDRPELSEELERQRRCVWLGSDFVARLMIQHPGWFAESIAEGLLARPRDLDELATELQALTESVEDEEALAVVLRRFRQREMLRIIWRDLADLAPLEETLSELSELAEVCVRTGLAHLHRWLAEKHGTPRDARGRAQQMVVLGMGKLGARELNLSSDIDLIFCYPRHGQTDGARPLDNETFFTRLGRRLANLLSRQTEEGFVFRVDMRLRPFGDAGPLAVSFDAMEQYLQAHAREWERYAMVKARPIAGDRDDRRELAQLIRAFVYRRYIDFGVIESIRGMKHMIEQELHRKGMEANIKLGEGGIREIEFIGQSFQLVRGGRDSDLQVRSIQRVLERLGDKGLLPEYAVRQLLEAYGFLRRTENRIQAWRDEQTHLIPRGEAGRERLAICMGFRNREDFEATLAQHRRHVHSHFEQVFESPQAEDEQASPLMPVWMGRASPEERAAAMSALGFADAQGLVQALDAFRKGGAVRVLSPSARERLDRLMPLAIEAAAGTGHPDQALGRLLQLLEAIVRRTAYLDLLIENPMALSQLLRLLAESVWVGTQLARMPILLDELLDPRTLYRPLRDEDLAEELATLLRSVDPGDLEQEMERLRQFALANRLRVAAADIAGVIPLMVVSDYLTEIAEVTLSETWRLAWRDLEQRHGRPVLPEPLDEGFLMIGYGKLGGIELGYGSDLDLVFLHGNENANAMTEGPKVIANDLFYARLGQRMIHILTTRMPSGILYEIDMRLRPNGNSGLLVSSLRAFERYQQEDAWTWEHQALVRARAVGGDPLLVEDFNRIRREVLCRPREPAQLATEVREMRDKMATSLDRSDAEHFDVKQGRGGLIDIEFLVQFAVLRWAHEHPGLTEWTDNARLLERLGEYGLFPAQQAERLFGVYRVYRAVVHRSALQEEKAVVPADRFVEERALVGEVWADLLGAG